MIPLLQVHVMCAVCLQVIVDVQQNPYERHRVPVMAECYTETLALEGLPQDMTDELRLPDQPLNQPGRSAFVLRNLSDKPYRSALLVSHAVYLFCLSDCYLWERHQASKPASACVTVCTGPTCYVFYASM